MQATGTEENTFLVFKLFSAIGNLFITLGYLIKVTTTFVSVQFAPQNELY